MKKLSSIKFGVSIVMMTLLVSVLFSSCKKDDNKTKPDVVPDIELGIPDSMSVTQGSSSHGIAFTSNTAWEASTDVDWITLANSSGNEGKDTLRFQVEANDGDQRIGKVTIKSKTGDLSKEVRIIQKSGLSPNFFVKEGESGEGHSWADATSLQVALETAVDGDTVFVAAGTYHPSKTITNGDEGQVEDKTFEVSKNITLIAGFSANASKGASSDPETNETILSGDLESGDSAYHVLTVSATSVSGNKVMIEGFTITAGKAAGVTSNFLIDGTKFFRNDGGGVFIGGNSVVEMSNCNIMKNSSGSSSAALFNAGDLVVRNSKINNNNGNGNGGVIWSYDNSKLTVYNSEIKDNYNAKGVSAGLYVYKDAELYMYNTVVSGNGNTHYGAGVYLRQSKGALVNCLITGNVSTGTNGGGGLLLYGGCDVSVISSTITGNIIAGPGGGIYRAGKNNELAVYNSIISGNTSKDNGPDIDEATGEPALKLESSVVGSEAYDGSGTLISGKTFDAGTMLDAQFLPVGSNNPALSDGMNAQTLLGLGLTLDNDYFKVDMKGKSRSGETVMGAILP